MPTIAIGDKTFDVPSGKHLSIIDGEVYVDDQVVKTNKAVREMLKESVEIQWKGDLVSLVTDKNVKCGNVGMNVAAGGGVDCYDILGDVESGGSIWANDIKGNVHCNAVHERTSAAFGYGDGWAHEGGFHVSDD